MHAVPGELFCAEDGTGSEDGLGILQFAMPSPHAADGWQEDLGVFLHMVIAAYGMRLGMAGDDLPEQETLEYQDCRMMTRTLLSLLLALVCIGRPGSSQTLRNFDRDGHQLTRFDRKGNAIDAHDGKLSFFNGTYYLYGTSYNCGFEWGNKRAPFCGFKVYTSSDLHQWKDEGFLFDAQSSTWQSRCDGKTYGCFRPHVVFNARTQRYVLWINVYDNRVGYRVFTATTPTGPFQEEKEPTLAINSDVPVAGLNNGDQDLFVDTDGTAYLAYMDWRTKGSIAIEKLSDDYLTGTGTVVRSVTDGRTEAPSLFQRQGTYYLVYSDPNCGYCSGTGASYRTAKFPLGPWSAGVTISNDSCGGQPSFVSEIPVHGMPTYLFGVDLWNHGAKNEAQANFYWAPLTFAPDHSIKPIICNQSVSLSSERSSPTQQRVKEEPDFRTRCEIAQSTARGQVFTAWKNGSLDELNIATFKTGYPDAPLTVTIDKTDEAGGTAGPALWSQDLPGDTLPWGAVTVRLRPHIPVRKGETYRMVLKSSTATGCYGDAFTGDEPARRNGAEVSRDGGLTFSRESGTSLRYDLAIH